MSLHPLPLQRLTAYLDAFVMLGMASGRPVLCLSTWGAKCRIQRRPSYSWLRRGRMLTTIVITRAFEMLGRHTALVLGHVVKKD